MKTGEGFIEIWLRHDVSEMKVDSALRMGLESTNAFAYRSSFSLYYILRSTSYDRTTEGNCCLHKRISTSFLVKWKVDSHFASLQAKPPTKTTSTAAKLNKIH